MFKYMCIVLVVLNTELAESNSFRKSLRKVYKSVDNIEEVCYNEIVKRDIK